MASKIFNINFNIAAKLASSYIGSFQNASAAVWKLGEASKETARVSEAVNSAYSKGVIGANSYANAVLKLSNNMAKMRFDTYSMKMAQHAANFLMIKNAAGYLLGPIKTAAEFESAMSKVGAILGKEATAANMDILSAQAKELGRTTQYTASQSAEAMSFLAMAGWKTQQILAGMPGLLNLAAAGGTDLARTADIVSDNLTAFGLGAEDAQRMADVYAHTITNTNTTVEMLGETMKYAAPVAKAFGASMEETAAMAGIMANSGIKASQAGTALRAGFLRLAGPPKMATEAMEKLGLSMEDLTAEQKEAEMAMASLGIDFSNTQGPEKMAAILTQLKEKLAGLSDEEKLANLKAIFGTTAATGWLAVMDNAEAFEKLTKELHDCNGEAKIMAEKRLNNAKGAMIKFQSAVESVSIAAGSTLLPTIAKVAESFADMASTAAEFAEKHSGLVSIFTAGTVALLGLAAAGTAGAWIINGLGAAFSGMMFIATKAAYVWRVLTASQWALNIAMNANPIGLVIAGLVGFVAIAKLVYDNCTSIRIAWDNWWASMEASYPIFTSVINGIFSLLSGPYRLICAIVDKVKEVIGLGPIDVSASDGMKAIRENATGGIYGKGAFLTTFAEDSGESAIPHTPNARNIGLLARTNEIMGNPLGGNNYSISIPITVNGGADASAASDIAGQVEAAVRRALDSINNQQRRVSYA